MRATRRLGSGVLAVVVALGLGSAAADAKIKVIQGPTKTAAVNTQKVVKVPCPKGMQVVSGGAYTGGSSLEDEVGDSAPYDNKDDGKKPDDGWIASLNAALFDRSVHGWAICSDSLKLSYRSEPGEPALSGNAFGRPACPEGARPVGGGMTIKGKATSSPLKAARPDLSLEEESWLSFALSVSNPEDQTRAYSICAKSDQIQYAHNSTMVPNQTQDDVEAQCPSETKVIGGGGGGGNFDSVELASILPSDGFDENSKPDDAWTTWSNNEDTNSAGADSIGSTAVCLG